MLPNGTDSCGESVVSLYETFGYVPLRFTVNIQCYSHSGFLNPFRICRTDGNFLETAQKLNHLLYFYPDLYLNVNPTNIKHLTALLLIDNNSLQVVILKTLTDLLDNPTVSELARQAMVEELTIIRDILITFCHNNSVTMIQAALKLLSCLSSITTWTFDAVDHDKIYLTLTSSNRKVQELGRNYFLQTLNTYNNAHEDLPDCNERFLHVVESFVTKYEVI